MKTPKFVTKLSAVFTARPKKKLQAVARAARPAMDDYDSEEPTTKLSSAFIVVAILHVVAVGGIYAFNSIKASRRDRETTTAAVQQPAAPATTTKSAPPHEKSAAPQLATAAPRTETPAAAPAPAVAKAPVGKQYEVKTGDNLTKIAFAYGVTAGDIMEANHLKDGALLRPGQLLAIPAKPAARPAAAKTETTPKQADVPPTRTTPGFYTVKKGDTATSIARGFGLSAEELLKVNKITDPKKLLPGKTLKVPPRKS